MPAAQCAFLTFLSRFLALSGGLAIWLGIGAPDLALAGGPKNIAEPAEYWTSAELWAWSQIKQDKVADFNKRCGAVSSLRAFCKIC
jgi:hypothetical protein